MKNKLKAAFLVVAGTASFALSMEFMQESMKNLEEGFPQHTLFSADAWNKDKVLGVAGIFMAFGLCAGSTMAGQALMKIIDKKKPTGPEL